MKPGAQPLSIPLLDRLSTKITLAAVVFVFTLTAAIAFLTNAGIRETQYMAYTNSREALSAQAENHLSKRASDLASVLSQRLQSAGTEQASELTIQEFMKMSLDGNTRALLIDAQGNLLGTSGQEAQQIGAVVLQSGTEIPMEETGTTRLDISGETMLLAYTPLAESGWRLALIAPLESVNAQSEMLANSVWSSAESSISSTLMLIMAISLVGLIGLAALLDRLVSRRVSALTTSAQAIAAGKLDVNVEIGDKDELGLLATAFNEMAAELKQREEILEKRVEERTQEISQLHAQAEQRSRELEALYLADEQLYRHLRLDQVLQALVDVSVDLLGADKASVQVWDPRSERLEVRAWRNYSPEALQVMRAYQPGDGIAGQVFERGSPMAVEDARRAPPPANNIAEKENIASVLSVPISVGGQVYGVFGMDYCQPRNFSSDEIQLFTALAQRAGIAIENAHLYEQAEQAATLEERQRVARELHDSVTQSLYSLVLLAEAGRRYANAGDLEQVEHHIGRLGETSRQALKEMRLLVYELRPLALREAGLEGALRQRLDAVEKRAGIRARLQIEGAFDLPGKLEEEMYRIAQEALNNSLKHAHASEVSVQIRQLAQLVEMEVGDDGVGFDAAELESGGIGLYSMRERAERLGGELEISSKPGEGTRVHFRLNLPINPLSDSTLMEVNV